MKLIIFSLTETNYFFSFFSWRTINIQGSLQVEDLEEKLIIGKIFEKRY